tara:strand:+ start:2575 stop:2937 length:363 start_codon:yes stop_codon:yes gene_type:complete
MGIIDKIFGKKKDKGLVPEIHLGKLAWTVATWMIVKEQNSKKKIDAKVYQKNIRFFAKLFLAQEKKRGFIDDFDNMDVQYLTTLALSCDPIEAIKLSKINSFDIKMAKAFEKEIGYKGEL